jgi:hypothetical protein
MFSALLGGSGNVAIAGCKMACDVCSTVLAQVKSKLKSKATRLFYDNNPGVDTTRVLVGVGRETNSGAKALNVDGYYG